MLNPWKDRGCSVYGIHDGSDEQPTTIQVIFYLFHDFESVFSK